MYVRVCIWHVALRCFLHWFVVAIGHIDNLSCFNLDIYALNIPIIPIILCKNPLRWKFEVFGFLFGSAYNKE